MTALSQGNLLRARDLWLKGIRKTANRPNPFLFQSVAVLAGEMGLTKESRKWFEEATRTFTGAGRHGIWQAWAQMEARQGNREIVRCSHCCKAKHAQFVLQAYLVGHICCPLPVSCFSA